MRYRINCTSRWRSKDVLGKYPKLKEYNPVIDYPYPNPEADRLIVEVDDLIKFYEDIGVDEIIIGKDSCSKDKLYSIEIYDDYRE